MASLFLCLLFSLFFSSFVSRTPVGHQRFSHALSLSLAETQVLTCRFLHSLCAPLGRFRS